jgi:ABC-type protease/lipase transport system fused ATPase/permease subunit
LIYFIIIFFFSTNFGPYKLLAEHVVEVLVVVVDIYNFEGASEAGEVDGPEATLTDDSRSEAPVVAYMCGHKSYLVLAVATMVAKTLVLVPVMILASSN